MLFNSLQFVFFLTAVSLLFYVCPHRLRWLLLLVASYTFYMCWNVFYIVLIIASTITDYTVGLLLGRTKGATARRALLVTSLAMNLGMLFVFKYWNFFNESAADICAYLGLSWQVPALQVLLPVGISFYTFQTLSYTIDLYRGKLKTETHFGRFALFVSFFPQLVAGPIERAGRLLPQLSRRTTFDPGRATSGLLLILWGLFKKVVIADRLAIYVDAVYSNVPDHNGTTYLLATYAFAFQIYCDFSGYSDIAIGSARLLGVNLMKNFNSPYFARNMQDFWHRWHISLSTWLRDYLYIPLGGNRHGVNRMFINLMITMLLGGLWHGSSWNFVLWGALHGVALAFLKATENLREGFYSVTRIPENIRSVLQMIVTFHFVCLTWVFFRADTLGDSLIIVRGTLSNWGAPFIDPLLLAHAALGLVTLLTVEALQARGEPLGPWPRKQPMLTRWAASYLLIFAILLLGVENGVQFIYFQF